MHSNAGLVNNTYKNEGLSLPRKSLCRTSSLHWCPVDCKPLCLPRHMQKKTYLSEIIYLACFPSTLPLPALDKKKSRYPLHTKDGAARASVVPILTLQLFLHLLALQGRGGTWVSLTAVIWQKSLGSFCFFSSLSCTNKNEEERQLGMKLGDCNLESNRSDGSKGWRSPWSTQLLMQVIFVSFCVLPPFTEKESFMRGSFSSIICGRKGGDLSLLKKTVRNWMERTHFGSDAGINGQCQWADNDTVGHEAEGRKICMLKMRGKISVFSDSPSLFLLFPLSHLRLSSLLFPAFCHDRRKNSGKGAVGKQS